jgi:membrane protease YdiL (CAAX protease family)
MVFQETQKQIALFLALIFLYFGVLIIVPWGQLDATLGFSSSYLFDFFYAASLIFFFRPSYTLRVSKMNLYTMIFGFTAICTLVILGLLIILEIKHPFHFLENPFLQLVIIAPLLEELIFRGALGGYQLKFFNDFRFNWAINGLVFSFSHLLGYWVVPEEYQTFIWVQVFYTFLLGALCYRSLEKTRNVLFPIGIHLVFNLMFYLFIKLGWY